MMFRSRTGGVNIYPFTLALLVAAPNVEVNGATIPVEDWVVVVNEGTSTVSEGDTNSPTFTPADAIQIAGGFATTTLDDKDFIQGTATLELQNRSTPDTGLGNQLRFALFREENGGLPTSGDGTGYTGYSLALQNNLREHFDATRAAPFSSGGMTGPRNVLAPAGVDPEGDAVEGEDVVLTFNLTIARDGNNLDISGSITDGQNYSQQFSVEDHLPDPVDFSWNRMAFLLAGNSNAEFATVNNATVTTGTIPEPASGLLVMLALGVGALVHRGGL